jgi:N4-(beta-N-acetylglucosaminyl)-L-asparaginase
MKTVGSFLVVELMRQGAKAQEACEEAVHRIMKAMPVADLQVGYLALGTDGSVGGHAIHSGFNYALHRPDPEDPNSVVGQLIDATNG